MIARRWLLQLSILSPLTAFAAAAEDPIAAAMARIRPLFMRKLPARPGDWLTQHDEPGQT